MLRIVGVKEVQRLHCKDRMKAQDLEDQERGKVLAWLSDLDFNEDHERNFAKRHVGTGNWLVVSEPFKEWLEEKKSCLLWCYGNPAGVGKSVLASIAVEDIVARFDGDGRIGVTFIYFSYENRGSQTPTKILSNLIKQMCRQRKELPTKVKNLYKQCFRDAGSPNLLLLQEVFLDLSKNLDQVYIVLDAMDECNLEDRKKLLPYLVGLSRLSSSRFKIFVTSRRETDIERSFTSHGFKTLKIEAKEVDTDIATFVHHQIQHIEEESLCVIDEALKWMIEEELVSNSGGMFLWVQCQLNEICQQPSTDDIRGVLHLIPFDINETYMQILRRIDKQVPAMRNLAVHVLMWVFMAARPLTTKELCEAAAIRPTLGWLEDLVPYTIKAILDSCANFITVEGDIVYPAHHTVKTFFASPYPEMTATDQIIFQRYRLSEEESHCALAKSCLQYLLCANFEYQREVPIFADYAYQYWNSHTQRIYPLPDCLSVMVEDFKLKRESLA